MRRKRKSPEYDLQKAVCAYLKLAGVKGIIWFAIPNGLVSDPISVSRMKAIGLRPGVADLCIIEPGGVAHFLELKSRYGKLSPDQALFGAECWDNGVQWWCVNNIDDAVSILRTWGLLRIDALPKKYNPPKAPRLSASPLTKAA